MLDAGVPTIRTGPITNLGDLCLTGPDVDRFTTAAIDRIEAASNDADADRRAFEKQWHLIHAKRIGDKVARLFPGAESITFGRRSPQADDLVIVSIEPYGPLDHRMATDGLAVMLDDDTEQLYPQLPPFSGSRDTVTVPIGDLQQISAADLDGLHQER